MSVELPLTVLHVRDPDGGCDLAVFDAAGRRLPAEAWGYDDVDAGRGWEADEWRERIAEARALPDSDYRRELVASLGDPPGEKYIDGWDEED